MLASLIAYFSLSMLFIIPAFIFSIVATCVGYALVGVAHACVHITRFVSSFVPSAASATTGSHFSTTTPGVVEQDGTYAHAGGGQPTDR